MVNDYIWTSQVFHFCGSDIGKIRELNVAGSITGFTQNKDALDRFFLISPELMSLIRIFQHDFGASCDTTKEHYQLSGTTAVRMFTNSSLIQ